MSRRITIELTEAEAKVLVTAVAATYDCCDDGETMSTFGTRARLKAVERARDKLKLALYGSDE